MVRLLQNHHSHRRGTFGLELSPFGVPAALYYGGVVGGSGDGVVGSKKQMLRSLSWPKDGSR